MGVGWAKTAVCEKLLHDHVSALDRERGARTSLSDGPESLLLPPVTAPEMMKEIVVTMEDATKSPGTDDEKQVIHQRRREMLMQLAEVIVGQMWLSMGQWRKVVDKTARFTAGDTTIGHQGYSYVLILKAFAYHGTPPT